MEDGAAPYGAGLRRPSGKSAETRARVVRGALVALEAYGLGETTTRRIADEAGLTLATLHYHFANKDAVLLAVLEDIVAELAREIAPARDREETHPARTLPASAAGPVLLRGPLPERVGSVVHTAWAYAERTRAKQIVQYELTLHALRTRGSDWLAAWQYDRYVAAYAAPFAALLDAAPARRLGRHLLAGLDGLILQRLAGAPDDDLAAGLAALVAGAGAYALALAGEGP